MDMAKICIDTGRSRANSAKIKAKAWESTRLYLYDAERDLMKALHNTGSLIEREYLSRDVEFLHKIKRIAQKPRRF